MEMAQGICPIGDHPFEYQPKAGQQRIYCSDRHQVVAASRRAADKRRQLDSRHCSRCKEDKPSGEFPGPSTGYCRPCHAEYARERRKINGIDPLYTRILNLRRYGLTPETFNALLATQDGRCAVCRTSEPGGQGWHVDHDHACCGTRKSSCGHCIRGILCTRCNIGIGNFKDDPGIIQAALDYITTYRSRRKVSDPAA